MSTILKPQRARDTTEEHLAKLLIKYKKLVCMVKYDGVRCIVKDNMVRGKSLLPIPNKQVQTLYGNDTYEGKEFEILVTENSVYNPVNCCNNTVSYTNSLDAAHEHICILIDDFHIKELPYETRLNSLLKFSETVTGFSIPVTVMAKSLDDILNFENNILKSNHEGIIVRNLQLPYREGMSSQDGELLRLKRFISEEAIIRDILPAMTNNNEQKTNLLGNSERSSHKENKVAKEEVGKLICETVKDIRDPWSGRLIISKGGTLTVAPGNMTKEEKIRIYKEKDLYIGSLINFKSFPKGTKDKPRFATFEKFVPAYDSPL